MLKCIRSSREGVLVDIHVIAGSKKEDIGYDQGRERIRIRIPEPAVKGKANRAILRLLSDIFGDCEIISGNLSRQKTILVKGKSCVEVNRALENRDIFID